MGGFGMLDSLAPMSHQLLLQVMPWQSAWLDNGKGEPLPGSVALASMLVMAQDLEQLPPEVYVN
jgi:hypothetical protein